MRIIVVIPARGGSKGIPRKNIRLMNGLPLISYAIKTALGSFFNPDVYVSTDSEEIADVAIKFGAKVLMRDSALAGDVVTLDPVIYDALVKAEKENKCIYDLIITMQPTSPLTSVDTLDKGIKEFISKKYNTLISVVNKPHLSWAEKDNKIVPAYEKRLNRQQLPKNYLETGAFVISDRDSISSSTRIGKKIGVFEVPEKEAVDIDNETDWIIAEAQLKKKRILFRADGYVKLGMGHIYNCITLAYTLIGHDILFVTREDCELGLKKIKESLFPYRTIKTDKDLFDIVTEYKPDIFVNDCLNTEREYIQKLKEQVPRVVTIEDLGPGAYAADAVINALYDSPENETSRFFSGYKYVCLRDEFLISQPKEFSEKVQNVVILFGGTDPSNLNEKTYKAALSMHDKYPDITFSFITGIGYDAEQHGVVTDKKKNIFVYPNVPAVTKYTGKADMAITSQGRTIYELAVLGIPSIVISQNQRETLHRFATMQHGFLNLGLGDTVDSNSIANAISWLVETPNIRKNMHNLMLKYDLKAGLARCKKIILGEYDA